MQRNDEWLNFFGSVAEKIVREIGPGTVLDAGCAMGFLVENLRARGVDARGVDISEYAVEQAHRDVRPYCWVGSITDALPQRYDLIVCIEVLEHLSPQEADRAIENLCKHADDILFSSTPFDYKEATHFNVRPPDYWAQRFAYHEFYRDIDFDASFLTPWAVRFRKTCEPAWRIVYSYERQLWQLEKELQARRELTVEQMSLLSGGDEQVRTLKEAIAEKEQTINALTVEINSHRENIESLTTLLNKEKERSQQLLTQDAERLQAISSLSQLSEQYTRLDSLVAPVVARQNSLEESVAQLLDSRNTIEKLVSQVDEKERTISALNAQVARNEQSLETLRAEVGDKQAAGQQLAAQLAEARATVDTLVASSRETEQRLQTLSAALADRDHAIRAAKSRRNGAEQVINTLTQQLAERDQTVQDLSALLTKRDAQLADVNGSMVWYVYNRIKYPYLLALYRLYERIKYPYLISVYRRLGLAARPAPQIDDAEPQSFIASETPFPVMEVIPPPAVPPHGHGVDVIICIHNALEDVKNCLESVIRYTRIPYTLILVDDGSNDETREYLAAFAASQGALLIRNEAARGYTLAANQGLRKSQSPYAVLLNSDTVVTPLWLDRMFACAEADPQVGLVGPLSNVASWQSIPEISQDGDWAENKLPQGYTVAEMGKLVEMYSARIYPRIPFLNGFCLMIKRSVIEQIGYFDEEVFGKGYGEENDYCLRARKAGWQLGVADDVYVYHAQSRSYSHERRKELSRHADLALASKHEPQLILDGVVKCQTDPILAGIRARTRAMVERKQLIEAGMELWEGKRVTFILTLRSACGGGNVVLDEVGAMRRMGVDARLLNLTRNQTEFERSYPENDVPVMYVENESQIAEFMVDCDAIIATANDTVYWLKTSAADARQPVKAYYVQDFEPDFFNPLSPGFKIAWDSYTEHRDLIRFTKTEWNRDTVRNKTDVECAVVGPSVNVDLFRPRRRRDPDWPVRPLRIAAMIRPSTPRRNPRLTMEVLREFHRAHGETVEIILFGSESSDPEFLDLPRDFAWRNAGMLTRRELAFLLNEIDIFVDFSEFQAMGLTAMEAMACGAAVIVPQKGGAGSFAIQERNALIVDTSSREACLENLKRLTLDEKLRARLQQQALVDVCAYHPERAAYNVLNELFPAAL